MLLGTSQKYLENMFLDLKLHIWLIYTGDVFPTPTVL